VDLLMGLMNDILNDAYQANVRHLFDNFYGEVASGQQIDEAAEKFRAGILVLDKVLEKAKEVTNSPDGSGG
jgi:hypothetical protein